MIPLFRNGKSILLHQQSALICHRAPEVWAAVLRAAGNCWNQLPAFQSWPNQGPTDTTAQRPAGPLSLSHSHICPCLGFLPLCQLLVLTRNLCLFLFPPPQLCQHPQSELCLMLLLYSTPLPWGDPIAPVLPSPALPSTSMLEAIQGVTFDPVALKNLEICLFYKLPLSLDETWHTLTLEDVPGQYTPDGSNRSNAFCYKTLIWLQVWEPFWPSKYTCRFIFPHDFLRKRVLSEFEWTRKGQQYGTFNVV